MVSLWLKATPGEPLTYAVEASARIPAARRCVCAGNLFIYYEKVTLKPSSLLMSRVFGAPKHRRSSYMLWNEPKAPDFVMEITSRRTRSQDQGPNVGPMHFSACRSMSNRSDSDYLRPPLRGLSLVGDNYELMPTTALPDGIADAV